MNPPQLARWLGLAGLLPQIAAVAIVIGPDSTLHFSALAMGYAYAALILSFLGGLWWGVAASHDAPPEWLWVAAITPSLLALATALPWAMGEPWPGPSLIVLGLSLIAALGVDVLLARRGLVPEWWIRLRIPLSLGLGLLTILLGIAR